MARRVATGHVRILRVLELKMEAKPVHALEDVLVMARSTDRPLHRVALDVHNDLALLPMKVRCPNRVGATVIQPRSTCAAPSDTSSATVPPSPISSRSGVVE